MHAVARSLGRRLPPSVSYDDLIRYGLAVLPDLLSDFNPFRGLRFKQYAVPLLRYRMIDGLRREYPHIRSRGAAHPAAARNIAPLTDAQADQLRSAAPPPDAAAAAADLLALLQRGLTGLQCRVLQLYFIDNLAIVAVAQDTRRSTTATWLTIQQILTTLQGRPELRELAGLRADQPFAAPTPRQTRFLIHGGSKTVDNRKRWPVRRKGNAAAAGEGSRREEARQGSAALRALAAGPAQDGQQSGTGNLPVSDNLHLPPAPSARKEPRERRSA